MIKSNDRFNLFFSSQILTVVFITVFCPANFAQEDTPSAPLPGSTATNNLNVPQVQINPETTPKPAVSTPIKSTLEKVDISSPDGLFAEDFPLSVSSLRLLVETYKEEAKTSPASETKLDSLLTWLDGLIKSHNKLALVFSKQNNLRANFDSEWSLVRELQQIRDEILYLKVQALIKEKKLKQAIPFLIEITCSEPNSPLGQIAYEHLKGSGFSPQIKTEAAKEPAANKYNKPSQPNKIKKSPKKK